MVVSFGNCMPPHTCTVGPGTSMALCGGFLCRDGLHAKKCGRAVVSYAVQLAQPLYCHIVGAKGAELVI